MQPTLLKSAFPRPGLDSLAAVITALLVGACMVEGSHVRPPAAHAGEQACDTSAWSDPSTIAEGTGFFYASAAGALPLIFGNWIPNEHEMPGVLADDSVFAAFGGDGVGRLPHPDGDFQFLYPVSVADPEGRVHLIWGESRDPVVTKNRFMVPHVTSIWHSLLADDQWTTPEEVFSSRSIVWTGRTTGVTAARGSIFLSFAVHGRPTTTVHRDSRGIWDTQEVRHDHAPEGWGAYGYTALAAIDSIIVLAKVAIDPAAPSQTTVFVSRARLDSMQWDQPVALMESSRDRISSLSLTAVDDVLYAVWLRREEGRVSSHGQLQHAQSHDGGQTWAHLEPLVLESSLIGAHSAVDPCGRLHVVLEPFPGIRPRLEYHRWSESGGWRALEAPFNGDSPAHPWLSRLPTGEPLLVYSRIEYHNGVTPRWVPTSLRISILGR